LEEIERMVWQLQFVVGADGVVRRQRCEVACRAYKPRRQYRGVIIPQLSCRLAAQDVGGMVFANGDPGVSTAIDFAMVCVELVNGEMRVSATLLPVKHFGGSPAQSDSSALSAEMLAALATPGLLSPSAVIAATARSAAWTAVDNGAAVDRGHKHSMVVGDHRLYIDTARALGEQREQQAGVVADEQQQRAKVHRSAQRATCVVASKIISAAGVHYKRCHPQLGGAVPSPFVILGMGAGVHETFEVRGFRVQASAWRNACRLAGRGLVISLIDEFRSSKVVLFDSVAVC
jgi:hypothetical protein